MVAMINLAPVESFTNCTKHFSNPDILQTHLHMLMNTHKVQSWFTFRDTHKNPYEAMIYIYRERQLNCKKDTFLETKVEVIFSHVYVN